MGLPDETSLECSLCGLFNINEGVIINGEIICWECVKKYPNLKLKK